MLDSNSVFRRPGRRRALIGLIVGLALAGVLLGAIAPNAGSQPASTKIRIVTLNGIPPGFILWAAKDLGYYKAEGLDVESLKYYPNGPSMVASGYANDWDAGYLGGPPAINAGAKFGLLVAGLLNWQRTVYKVYVRKDANVGNLTDYLKGKTALTITASNLQFFLDACLRHYRVDPTSVKNVNLTPPNIVTAANGGQGEIISDWAPFTFVLDATGKYRAICDNNKQVGIETFDALVIQPKFAEAHPQAAAAFLRAAYRVNEELNKDRPKMLGLTQKYLNEVGIKMTPDDVKASFETMTFPNVDESLDRMKSGEVKRALQQSAKFLVSIGAMDKVPDINFVTAKYLEMAKTKK
jgi:ABC-type nitrate/sulfonate/bicarbonate transport system substrate-binding protein